ncbi:YqjF family protein [Rufibacter sp. LB8]|uniref:YqjF family protein n=1 Tax=Rufibacter sp. LB8 TaxID=2777781 RepID=UPI00178C7EFC|nr:DUF2071 domain-containing protein [Rufibacter sp. LB8]
MNQKKNFLTAEWRKLIMANYAIDPSLLLPYLPANTQLDLWNGACYVSLIGFLFTNTKIKGVKVPFHSTFEEVNLRFYVTYNDHGTVRRGVVFLKEIVPKPAITLVANTFYGEHYQTLPMAHSWQQHGKTLEVAYRFKQQNWQELSVTAQLPSHAIAPGSEAEFITEHYWGYTKRKNGRVSGYEVAHPVWDTYPVLDYAIEVDFGQLYGHEFEFLRQATPTSVFLAEGSAIEVKEGGFL